MFKKIMIFLRTGCTTACSTKEKCGLRVCGLTSPMSNNRLFALVFFYQDTEVEELYKVSSSYLNLTVFGPTKAIINGTLGEWEYNEDDLKPDEKSGSYWDSANNKLTLGDFNQLINFLVTNSGKKENIEAIANGH